MTRYLLAGAAAALITMAGVASAQDVSTESSTRSTTTTTVPAPAPSYSESKSEKTYDSNGNVIEKKQSVQKGSSGTSASSSTRVKTPFGEESRSHEETTTVNPAAPTPLYDSTTTRSSTTTTTTGQ